MVAGGELPDSHTERLWTPDQGLISIAAETGKLWLDNCRLFRKGNDDVPVQSDSAVL